MEAAGTVEAVGSGAGTWAVGDQVFGGVGKPFLGAGSFAESVTMTAGAIARRPTDLPYPGASSLTVAGATALAMAEWLEVAPGDPVLVLGATGGVGSYLVQLLSRAGGHVIAVNSLKNEEYARELGAADVVDYTEGGVATAVTSLAPQGLAAIADLHGDREVLANLTEQLRPGGKVSSATGSADAAALEARGMTGSNVRPAQDGPTLARLAEMVVSGHLRDPEVRAFTLPEAAAALAAVGTGHTRGKIVLLVVV
jgi:NADPH:quinone reductase-like Zn-dependent oxidoreductase